MTDEKKMMQEDIENVLKILDGFASGDESRMKLLISEMQDAGTASKVHHLGRCDIGSPWARGECFDAPEADCDKKG